MLGGVRLDWFICRCFTTARDAGRMLAAFRDRAMLRICFMSTVRLSKPILMDNNT